MKKLMLTLCVATAAAAHAAPGAHGPNGEHLEAPSVAAPGSLARLPDASVHVPMRAQRRLGIRTVLAKQSQVAATVELPGRVLMDPNAGGRVQTLAGGKVQPGPKGLPVVGQAVRKGEVLGYVGFNANPIEAANQQALLAELRSSHHLAGQRVRRLESLEGTVPQKEIDAAHAELRSLAAREQAIARSVGAREALRAPIAGVIATSTVVAGQVVEPKDVLFEVIDPARMLVEATTPDVSLASQVGQATVAGLPAVTLEFLGAARSLREGNLPLTFRATADGAVPLAVGQPVTVLAALSKTVTGYVLPAQAITRSPANEPIVWIKAGAQRYIPQPVRVEPLDAQTVVVTQGLGADNRVVVQGAALIAQIR